MNKFGYVNVAVVSPQVAVGNPEENVNKLLKALEKEEESSIVFTPELGITGYTCADLFSSNLLLKKTEESLIDITHRNMSYEDDYLLFVGAPVRVGNSLYNCAVAINGGEIIGVVPKQNIPNYKEFYEARWFTAADGSEPKTVNIGNRLVPFGVDLLFKHKELVVSVEICEDLWVPVPPSSLQALAGATIQGNLSASNEVVTKGDYRRNLVQSQSGRNISAYFYVSAGPSESTTDLVFGKHCIIAENGKILHESKRVGTGLSPLDENISHTVSIDVEKLNTDRRAMGSYNQKLLLPKFREIDFRLGRKSVVAGPYNMPDVKIQPDKHPFVSKTDKKQHCAEIFEIQVAGLSQRLQRLPKDAKYNIGISGGLDSTLALLVALKACKASKIPTKQIQGITMPGFGTTDHTKSNAFKLMNTVGISKKTIDIRWSCLQDFKSNNAKPFGIDCTGLDVAEFEQKLQGLAAEARHDLQFENMQARKRTYFLMSEGFVIGTGDLSELALGWCTYNGDHMSMYNPNCSIPKTLVKHLVQYVADNSGKKLKKILKSILDTTISPELLPVGKDGGIEQSTESVLGPYVLHDFILYHFIRNNYSPKKIFWLMKQTFDEYDEEMLKKTLRTFFQRFFSQQYKRSTIPDGPKVGTVSLSPRGDWRMPSDMDANLWLENI